MTDSGRESGAGSSQIGELPDQQRTDAPLEPGGKAVRNPGPSAANPAACSGKGEIHDVGCSCRDRIHELETEIAGLRTAHAISEGRNQRAFQAAVRLRERVLEYENNGLMDIDEHGHKVPRGRPCVSRKARSP